MIIMNNYKYITKDLPRMLDVSAVQAQSGIAEVKKDGRACA